MILTSAEECPWRQLHDQKPSCRCNRASSVPRLLIQAIVQQRGMQ